MVRAACPLILVVALVALPVAGATADSRQREAVRIVAVGDLHGDYETFHRLIRAIGIIDEGSRWTGGSTHLVQTGDILDRGPDSKKILDLLMKLSFHARRSGGDVHVLLGNHEIMNLTGDHRYAHDGEISAFGDLKGYRTALGPDGKYGRFLRSLPAVIRIDRTLFVHGGISNAYVKWDIDEINARVAAALADPLGESSAILTDSLGPFWFRGLAGEEKPVVSRFIGKLLRRYAVDRIVVGHTVAKGGIRFGYDGRVVMIDTGMSTYYEGGPPMALLIRRGRLEVLDPFREDRPSLRHRKKR